MAVPFSKWTRQEKDEFAQKKMDEMRVRNESLKKRYAEVEEDRLKAEAKNSAFTKISYICKDKKSSVYRVEEVSREREWDRGKRMNDGDWNGESYDENRKSNWKSFSDKKKGRHYGMDSKYYHREAEASKFTGSDRNRYINSRNQDNTFYRRNTNSDQDERTLWYNTKNSRCDYPKSDKPSKVASIGMDAGIRDLENMKSSSKSENDPTWLDEGTTDSQHKQIRIEKWVKSLNSESSWDDEDINQPVKQSEFDLPYKCTKKEKNEPQKTMYYRKEERYENSKSNDARRKPPDFTGSFQQKHDVNVYDSVSNELNYTDTEKQPKTSSLPTSDGLWEDVEDDDDIIFVNLNESLSDYEDSVLKRNILKTEKEECRTNEHAHVSNPYKIKETALRSSGNYLNVESDSKWKSSKSNFEESNENYKVSSQPLNIAKKIQTGSASCNKMSPSQNLGTTQYQKGNQSSPLEIPKKSQVNKGVTKDWDSVNTGTDEKCDVIDKNETVELGKRVVKKNYVSKYDNWADAVDIDVKWDLDDEDLIKEQKHNATCNQKVEPTNSSVGKAKTVSSDGWANDPDNDIKWNLNE